MDMYSTAVLSRVVSLLPPPSTFLLDQFFPMELRSDKAEIFFDVDKSKPRITPMVHPTMAGKVVADRGFQAMSFKPAYAKDKRVLMPDAPIRRRAGEQIGGEMKPMARRQAQLNDSIDDQLDMLTRRETVMGSEALRTGRVTVTGENYAAVVVDFLRDAGLTVALSGGARWGEAGVLPLDSLESWAETIQGLSGAAVDTVVMDPKAWGIFRKDADVKERLNKLYSGQRGSLDIGPVARGPGNKRARYHGDLGDFDFWSYQDTYIDENGATQKMLPDYTVLMGLGGTYKEGIQGTRCYGTIMDEEAGYKADRYHIKSWVDKDPAVRYLLLQSAPLVVPFRPNASFCATVR